MHAFFELHIEQGPILEAENKDIGVVTHGQGLNWLQVTVIGRESHTGSTPMPMRLNAGLGMARITELVHKIAMENQPDAVGAVGHCDVYPNSRNIIPGKCIFTIDFRSPSLSTQEQMESKLRCDGSHNWDNAVLKSQMQQRPTTRHLITRRQCEKLDGTTIGANSAAAGTFTTITGTTTTTAAPARRLSRHATRPRPCRARS